MPNIVASSPPGTIACSLIQGEGEPLKEQVHVWRIPGKDGWGAQQTGLGAGGFRFLCVKYDSEANVTTWATAMGQLSGLSGVSVTNDWGDTFTNLVVERVSVLRRTPAYHEGGVRGEITIEGRKTHN